jgi:hypothetical protein
MILAGAVVSVLIGILTSGSHIASADAFTGKTYADAAATIAEWKSTSVIATVSGSQLSTDECIVVSWSKSIFRDTSGTSRSGEYLLNLNCNRTLASPGHPGGSLMTPEGRQQKKDEVTAGKIAKNPAICESADTAPQWCERICNKTGLCEYEA